MGRSKAPSKKQQSRGVDFKKFKHKLGRKLPPPKNATNTEIKSKAIILPEQSVALDKAGLAVSKKGLTLKELLQQTSHHNAKVRKDALLGIRELLLKYPTELKLHKLAVIEKLRERICDDDKVIRETLYQLFKSVILPGCEEDNQGALISLIMAYIFNAMTHLSIDVRLMAFKFFDLAVQNYPPAFSSYAEKVLENYMDILQKNQFYLEDKSKLKGALSGLVRCLSLLPSNERVVHSSGQIIEEKQVLHAFETDVPKDSIGHTLIIRKLNNLVPILVNCFDGLILVVHSQPLLDSHSFDCMLSILQSIDLVVQYYLYGIGKHQQDIYTLMSSSTSSEICVQDQEFPPLLLDKLFSVFPMQPMHHLSEKDDHRYFILNTVISQIFFTFSQWICPPPGLLDEFLRFLVDVLSKVCTGELSDKVFYEKHLLLLVPFIPKLVSTVDWSWKHPLLQAFSTAFGHSYLDSSMKMACLKAVEEMLVMKQEILCSDAGNKEILDYQRIWIKEIGLLLNSLGNKHPTSSHAVLHLLLRLGQIGLSNSDLAEEYDKLQDELQKFYCIDTQNGHLCYGPFMELPIESQEISICCLYYFSSLKQPLLASLALCCLSHSLEPSILTRIIEVLQSSYIAGHIQIADLISFFITLLSQYEIATDGTFSAMEEGKLSKQVTFRSVTDVICSFLPQMGDQLLILQILEEVVIDLTSLKLSLDNICALMRMLTTADSRPSRLSEKCINKLGDTVLSYMIEVALLFPENHKEFTLSSTLYRWRYYLLPCFLLIDRSPVFLKHLLDKMGTFTAETCELTFSRDTQCTQDYPRKIEAVVSVFSMMCMDVKMRRVLSSCRTEVDNIMQSIQLVQSSAVNKINIEQQHKLQGAVERLKDVINEISNMASQC